MIYSTLQYSKKDSNPPAQVLKTHQQDKHVPYVIKEIGNGGGKKNKGKKKKKMKPRWGYYTKCWHI